MAVNKESLKKAGEYALIPIVLIAIIAVAWSFFNIAFLSIIVMVVTPLVIIGIAKGKIIVPLKAFKKNQIIESIAAFSILVALPLLFTYTKVAANIESVFYKGHIKNEEVFVDDDESGHNETEYYFETKAGKRPPIDGCVILFIWVSVFGIPFFNHKLCKKYASESND